MRGGRELRDRVNALVPHLLGERAFAALDADFREFVRTHRPAWDEVFRSLAGPETKRIQIAFRGTDAVAWRLGPRTEPPYSLGGTVEILPNYERQMNLLLDRTKAGFLAIALRADSGIVLFEYEAKGSVWRHRAEAKVPAVRVGEPFAVRVRVETGRVSVAIDGAPVMTARVPDRALDGPGAWARWPARRASGVSSGCGRREIGMRVPAFLVATLAVLIPMLARGPIASADTAYHRRTTALAAAIDVRMGSAEGKTRRLLSKAAAALDDVRPTMDRELKAFAKAAKFLVKVASREGEPAPEELAETFDALREDLRWETDLFADILGSTDDPHHPGSSVPVPAALGKALARVDDDGASLVRRVRSMSKALRVMRSTHSRLAKKAVYRIACIANGVSIEPKKPVSGQLDLSRDDGHAEQFYVWSWDPDSRVEIGLRFDDGFDGAGTYTKDATVEGPDDDYLLGGGYTDPETQQLYLVSGVVTITRFSAAQGYVEGTFQCSTHGVDVQNGTFRVWCRTFVN